MAVVQLDARTAGRSLGRCHGGPEGGLVLPLQLGRREGALLQCHLGRLNNTAAVLEGVRFTVGVAEDLTPGIAQEHRAGGIFQEGRFPALKLGALLLDPALRRLDDSPRFSEREGSAGHV